jgi:hypothetical protein
MKQLITSVLAVFISLIGMAQSDTVRIANDSLEYEITIVDPQFSQWMVSGARPRWFYSLEYLESRNRISVANWNARVGQTSSVGQYDWAIPYDPRTRYGYEVNYILFNWFEYTRTRRGLRVGRVRD